jgi:hypothetical protein
MASSKSKHFFASYTKEWNACLFPLRITSKGCFWILIRQKQLRQPYEAFFADRREIGTLLLGNSLRAAREACWIITNVAMEKGVDAKPPFGGIAKGIADRTPNLRAS